LQLMNKAYLVSNTRSFILKYQPPPTRWRFDHHDLWDRLHNELGTII
jgi:hypothetical protein